MTSDLGSNQPQQACLRQAPTYPNNLPTSRTSPDLSKPHLISALYRRVVHSNPCILCLHPTSCICIRIHAFCVLPATTPCLRRLRPLLPRGLPSGLIFKLKDPLNFHPINNSVLSSLPITVTFTLICRLQTKTDTILVWGNHVEVPQGIHKAMFFFRRDRVGEQCSLLFHQLFQPHVFQVRSLCSV